MQVGAGTGYFTAVLAELVGPSGRVCAFEIDEDLAATARTLLAEWPWVSVEARSGVLRPDHALQQTHARGACLDLGARPPSSLP